MTTQPNPSSNTTPLSQEVLLELVDGICIPGAMSCLEKEGELHPMAFLALPSGGAAALPLNSAARAELEAIPSDKQKVILVTCPIPRYKTQEGKRIVYASVAGVARELGAIAMLTVHDVSFVKVPKGQALGIPEGGVHVMEEKQDAILVTATGPGFTGIYRCIPYHKDAAGKFVFGEDQAQACAEVGGNMAVQNNLLEEWWLEPQQDEVTKPQPPKPQTLKDKLGW